jgi:putative ABC transport system ATP-binding protein
VERISAFENKANSRTFGIRNMAQAETVIDIRKLVRNFKLGNETIKVLKSVDLLVQRGEYVALMGPSGSGKSTLMNILGCLDTPTEGEYYLNGREVAQLSDNELAEIRNKEIGFIFQTFNLLPRSTALDNVILPLIYAGLKKDEREKQAKRALDQVALSDRMMHRPNELSGGQRQRVAIARALVNNPSILLADEPTGNLDTKTSIEIMGLLHDIHKSGNTIIIVTHEEDIAQHAHRIIRLRDGVIESDTMNPNIRVYQKA